MSIPRIKKMILKKISCFAFLVLLGALQVGYTAGFTDTHSDGSITNNPDGANWTVESGNAAQLAEGGGDIGLSGINSEGIQLVNDYSCTNNGTFEVDFLYTWNPERFGIVFRWTGSSSYYFAYIRVGAGGEEGDTLKVAENSLSATSGVVIAADLNMDALTAYNMYIVLNGEDALFYLDNTYLGTFNDNSHAGGRVGYAVPVGMSTGGMEYSSATWTDHILPIISAHPSNAIKAVGESVTFTVVAFGDPPISGYQWKKDGVSIAGAINSTFTIDPVTLDTAGIYTVDVTNAQGTVTSDDATLTVYEPAKIDTDPVDVTVNIGNSAPFSITASGTPPLSFQWYVDSTGSWLAINGATSNSYSFPVVHNGQEGFKFRCVVTGYNSSTAASATATLHVTDKATIITEPVPSREAPVGDSVIFSVVSGGQPVPTREWQKKNGGAWTVVGGDADTFTITSVSIADADTFRVRVENIHGKDTSNEIVLNVFGITVDPVNDTVLVNTEAMFFIDAIGSSLSYQWQKNDSSWSDITGEISDTLKFNATAPNDGNYCRCIVTVGSAGDTSESALLTIGSIPSVPDQFLSDTVLPVAGNCDLSASATAIPAPAIEWFFIPPATAIPEPKGTGTTLSLTNPAKADSGTYYFVAANKFGSTSSDSIIVHVCVPINIVNDLPAVYTVIDGGEARFSISASGDGLYAYRWYENGVVLTGQTANTYSINPVDSAAHDGNTYFCEVWNTVLGKVVGIDTSTVSTIDISKFYNPFKVKVERIGEHITDRVQVKLWSDVAISNFPTTQSLTPWADSVWVIYKAMGFPPGLQNVEIAMFSTEEIKQAVDTLAKTISVVPLKPGGTDPFFHDSCYWFSYSVLWHDPGKPDTLLVPFATANKVFMIDTLGPPNPLVVHGEYVMKTDTIKVIIDSITKLNSAEDSLVLVQCSKFSDFNSLMFTDTLSAAALIGGGDSYTLILIDSVDNFPLQTPSGTDTVYCKWFVVAKSGAVSIDDDTSFAIGWPRPVYTGTLTADSTKYGGQIFLTWNAPAIAADSIQAWWSTDTIPLNFEFSIPASQSKRIDPLVTSDTIKGLDNDKPYCVALQVLKDDMWSMVTVHSRAWTKTALGDTSKVPNIISIDSTWFKDLTNEVYITWHIDTLAAPGGRTYEAGYVVGFDSATVVDAAQTVLAWTPVTQKVNQTSFQLYPDIVFDTTYTVGLWLRGFSVSLGAGMSSEPTDSSLTTILTPKFTWQEITLFTDTADTVYVANQSIIFAKITKFNIVDTLWAFNPDTLPDGFVQVGGVSFKFNNSQLQIPPTMLGLKYDSLPVGVTESDLGLYKYHNGQFYVMHGFTVSNGVVWDTIKSSDVGFPFLVLADILPPDISVTPYNDTITNSGAYIPTRFGITDNVSNTCWQFKYGPGDEGYLYGERDTLNSPADTSLIAYIKDQTNVINQSFGVRAIIIADDGVHRDTMNVSRCVRTDQGEAISVPTNVWVPLRTTTGLDNPALDVIFNTSIISFDQWAYDIYKYRLYRWYDNSGSGRNNWVEYSDAVKDIFSFIPGRLIWLKSAKNHTIFLGTGVTTSLKKPYEIVLAPKNWTDLTLPFQFPVMLRDILETTGLAVSDSIFVYHWQKSGNIYEAIDLYNPKFDSITGVVDTIKSQQKYDGYTVYNQSAVQITLRIPPISLPLSQYSAAQLRESEPGRKKWNVHFKWTIKDNSDEMFYRRVRCGYAKSEEETEYGILPPSMSAIRVGILDSSRDKLCGWALEHELDQKGGVAFIVSLNNYSQKDVAVEYHLANLSMLPEGFNAKILNKGTNAYEGCSEDVSSTLTIPLQDRQERVLVIGSEGYLNHIIAAFLPMKLLKAYPNPFNGRMKIHYRIPMGIQEIQFTLFNVQGRTLWKGIDRRNITPGEHIFFYNGKSASGNALSAGVYILRMTAKNAAGKTVYGGRKRLTCLK